MNSKSRLLWSFCAALLVVSITTFTSEYAQAKTYDKQKLNPVKLYWADRSTKERAKRVNAISRLIGIDSPGENRIYEKLDEVGGLGNWMPLTEEHPDVMLKVLPDFDEIRIIDADLAEDSSGKDVGEKVALEVATKYLAKLKKNDLVNGWHYDPKHYQIGQHLIGEGSLDGKIKRNAITEYRVTFRANVNGIQLANSGVRIAVHRTGRISGLRIGGVSGSVIHNKVKTQVVSDEQIQNKIRKTIPRGLKPRVAWQRVMYVMPENEKSAVVEPLHVMSYSLVGTNNKEEVISRRKTIGISLTDVKASVIDFSKPARKHQATKITRDPSGDKARHQKFLEGERRSH